MRTLGVSFRTRLIVGALLSLFAVVTPLYLLDVRAERAQQMKRFESHANLSADLLGQTVEMPLWDFNYAFFDNLFARLKTDARITSATLTDVSGDLVGIYNAENELMASPYDLTVTRDVIHGSGANSEVIGALSISFSGTPVDFALNQYMVRKLMSLIILLSLTGIVLWFVLGHILVPIRKLIEAIGFIKKGEFGNAIPGIRRSDEIGAVADALDQLRLAEFEMQQLRAERDVETQRAHYRMVHALESTEDCVMLLDENGNLAMQNNRAMTYFGTLRKGESVDLTDLIHGYDPQQSVETKGSVNTIVSCQNAEIAYELRVRIDPIQDGAGTSLGHVFLASDITEQRRQTRRADFLASHDSLTGLANRRTLKAELEKCPNEPIAVLVCDLDRFKQINDTLGHIVGDDLLKRIADHLRDIVGNDGIPIRLGGDEFAIILHGVGARERIMEIGHQLLERLAEPQIIDGKAIKTGMSIGLASSPKDTATPNKLIQMADLALYDAKKSGRGILRAFRSSLEESAVRGRLIEAALGSALANGTGPWAVYQKQTDAKTGVIVGFEALARWEIPDLGSVAPNEFIPISEDSGLITEITTNILRDAFKTARDLGQRGFTGRVAVNISPILFDGRACNLIKRALEQTRCPSHLVEIEITEQVLLSDQGGVRREIERIREFGVNVALDDFGVGFSSLSYLKKFPVDKIKIDRVFVTDLETSKATRSIVAAIAQLGHALNMTVTGEGVETDAVRTHLTECGIDTIQGWIDGKPLSEKDVFSVPILAGPSNSVQKNADFSLSPEVVKFPKNR